MKTLRNRLMNLTNWQVLGILLIVSLGLGVGSALLALLDGSNTAPGWLSGWLQNLSSEMLGAFLTFVLLELLVRRRDEKERLMRQMHSKDNGLALQAVAELGAQGWLTDGSLNGANLVTANLANVHMWDAMLKSADLHGANLSGAKLERCNLSGANLWNANLERAYLANVNLEGADLFHASLTKLYLLDVEFDRATRLPDGSYWTPETDLTRYVDPAHPQFFEPETVSSRVMPRPPLTPSP